MAVFQRDGSWWVGYPLASGKYRREKVGGSHALAKEVLAKRLAEVAEGKFFPGRTANGKKFSDFADRFWDLHAKNLRAKGREGMVASAKARFGSMSMGGVKAGEVQRYYNEILQRNSVATANRHLSFLRLMFNKAKAWGEFFGENPCAAIRPMREPQGRLRFLSVEEMGRLLSAAHPRLYPAVLCALLTGMRRGEILGLDWKNVDLKQGTLYLILTKSGRPRELPIGSKLRTLIEAQGPKTDGPVFGLPLIMLRRYWLRALTAAGIRDFRFHDLRHTFASHFIMRTNDLPALQKLLGHSTPTMTLRYAHLSRGHLASEMAAFESAVPARAPLGMGGDPGRREGPQDAQDLPTMGLQSVDGRQAVAKAV